MRLFFRKHPASEFILGFSFFMLLGKITPNLAAGPVTKVVPIHKVMHQWTRTDSLSFAQDQLLANADKQFACLKNLWGKESGWNPHAKKLVRSQGLHAGGIPQLLGMSPLTPPSAQIRRGLRYIEYRYATPCIAWQHWQQKGWY